MSLSAAGFRALPLVLLGPALVLLPRRIPFPFPFPFRLPFLALTVTLVVVAHAGSSMAIRSAAIPREPYAFTEPSDTPSVSATWASVMSAK